MFKRCEYEYDTLGIYLLPIVGYSNVKGDKSFWFGWLWWLWTVRLTKRAADGWLGSAFDWLLGASERLANKFPGSATRR